MLWLCIREYRAGTLQYLFLVRQRARRCAYEIGADAATAFGV